MSARRRRCPAWVAALLALLALATVQPGRAEEDDQLNMGFYLPGIRDANPADVRVSLQLWAEEVGREYDIKARASIFDDMRALRRAVDRGSVNLVIAPGMELAEHFAPDELVAGFAGIHRDSEEGVAVIVAQTADIGRFADLRGKRVLRLSNDRLADVFLELQCRRQIGLACREAFRLGEEKRDIQSIHKVFFGQADAALVSLSALHAAGELNPQIRARLRVLLDWKAKSLSFGMMTTHSAQSFRDRVLRSAVQATKTVRGRQILEIFKTEIMAPTDQADLQPFWRLHREDRDPVSATPTRKK